MEDGVYYALSVCLLSITMCISTIGTQDTTPKDKLFPSPVETPPPPLTIESEVIGPFRIWHIVGICAAGVLIIVIIVCCCVDVRIPRSKEAIEEGYQRRILNKKYTKEMSNPFSPEPDRSPPKPPPKRLPNRIPATNPSFTPDDADIIYASEPPRKSRPVHHGKSSRTAGYRQDNEHATSNGHVSRNPPALAERKDYQARTFERAARAFSSISDQRDHHQAQHQHNHLHLQRDHHQHRHANGSAARDNSQNVQRERLAHQSSRAQQHEAFAKKQRHVRNQPVIQGYDLEDQISNRAPAEFSRAKRLGVQTPLANHPSAVLGPKRTSREEIQQNPETNFKGKENTKMK
ncbi:uncharacterized protein LOC135477793 [Liolophura sinensis]|uniref:uncharacterized protein LOC135477793 n=1 Tax=Liolophura sinensis TaxID=3198878 RepID=UPI0031593D26